MHQARKRFGQNFLHDQYIIEQIIHAFHPMPDDNVIEIGPGLGALTSRLLPKLNSLIAIEIDKDLPAHLAKLPFASKLTLVDADALKVDYGQFGNNLRIIGNLPYNISTPLIFTFLHQIHSISDMLFMLQKEVVERMAAGPGTKDYGRLSIMLQYHCEVEHLFNVPAEAFTPQPKVESAIVSLTPYEESPFAEIPFGDLEKLVAKAFAMRRKTIANNLKGIMSASDLDRIGIDPGVRPEQISINEYVQIAKFVSK